MITLDSGEHEKSRASVDGSVSAIYSADILDISIYQSQPGQDSSLDSNRSMRIVDSSVARHWRHNISVKQTPSAINQ